MKKLFIFCGLFLFTLAFSQKTKQDSTATDKKLYEYKARIFYPYDCSCPGTVIYKKLKKGDKDFSPYQYKYQNPIKLDSLNEDDKKKILDYIRKA